MNTPFLWNIMLRKTEHEQVVDRLSAGTQNFKTLGPIPSMHPALVGFKDDSAVKTSSSVMEISLRVNTGVGKSSMGGRTKELYMSKN